MAVHVRPLIANELTDGCSICLELDEDRPQVKGRLSKDVRQADISLKKTVQCVSPAGLRGADCKGGSCTRPMPST